MQQKTQNLLDILPIGAVVLSRSQDVVYANDAFMDFIGYSEEELRGMSIQDITDTYNREKLEKGLRELYAGERDHLELETAYLRKDGARVWGYPVRMLFPVEEFEVEDTLLMLVVDITERRKLEQHARRSERLNALGLLAASIAHDFNNLLTVIKSQASLLAAQPNNTELVTEYTERINRSCERGAELTRELVTFGVEDLSEIEKVDINAFMKDVHQVYFRLLPPTITFDLSLSERAPTVMTQRGRLHQIVTNLIINARDAMQDRGTLSIETRLIRTGDSEFPDTDELGPGNYTLLRISDTGMGIAPENIPKIFDPFFTTKGDVGTGMGLTTVAESVARDNGYLHVEPKGPGGGACFEIYLPADSETYQAQKERRREQGETPSSTRPRP